MGLLDWLTGGSSGKSNQNTEQNVDKRQVSGSQQNSSTQTGSVSESQSSTSQNVNVSNSGTQTSSLLDEQSLGILQQALARAGGTGNIFSGNTQAAASALNDFASSLATRAQGAEQAINERIAADVAALQNDFNQNTMRDLSVVSQGIGSTENSAVMRLIGSAQNDLATRIAQTQAAGAVAARNAANNEINMALQGLTQGLGGLMSVDQGQSAATNNLAALANALKGATSSTTTNQNTIGNTTTATNTRDESQQTQNQTVQNLSALLEQIAMQGKTSGKTSQGGSLLDIISALGRL